MRGLLISVAANAFGYWQHSLLAGVFVFATLYLLVPPTADKGDR